MTARLLESEALRAVSPIALHSYLKAQHWERGEDFGERGVVYLLHGATEVFAPGSIELGDYVESVFHVIEALSQAEDRSSLSVLRDLLTADRDLIRFRAPEAEDDGSIAINPGVELIQNSREALLAAACSAVATKRYYRAGRNQQASQYLERVKLGQTEQGSFVITLLSPVPPSLKVANQPEFWPVDSDDPFERRVTKTFAKALLEVRKAISEVGRGSGIEAFESAVPYGVSANLCDALSKLTRDGNGLEVSLTWATTRPLQEKRHKSVFEEAEIEVLREAARLLRDKEPRPNEVIEGFVTRLAREEEATEGTVTLKALVDGAFKSVSVDLDATLYGSAVDAHKRRKRISLEGDLERQGHRWKLVAPRRLETVGEDEDE